MRIAHIRARNFLGLSDVALDIASPVALICGPNGAGKSSLRDAVALALTGDLCRVHLKKDAGHLVHAGARSAEVEVIDADGDRWHASITAAGAMKDGMRGREIAPALQYVLDAQRFAALKPDERRAFLFGLMNVGTDREQVVRALVAEHGCDAAKVQRIAPMLRSGFPAAHDAAKEGASGARGAWRAVTGEAYGATKAETWRPEPVAFSPAALAAAQAALADADAALAAAEHACGALDEQRRQRAAAQDRLQQLQSVVDLIGRRRTKLATDEEGLSVARLKLQTAEAKAGTAPRVGLVHDLARAVSDAVTSPHCAGYMQDAQAARAALAAYEAEHGPVGDVDGGDPTARAELPNLRDQVELLSRCVQNAMRDLRAAEDAGAQALVLQQQLAEPFDADGHAKARDARDAAQARRKTAAVEVDRLAALQRQAASLEQRAADAQKHHAEALAWDALAAALAPDGIPAALLAAALKPINDRLAQSAADAAWPQVRIADDMEITAGGRPYRLLSESERWRCDAMLAEAITQQSGCGLLVLDRVDVLDLPGRGDLLAWMECLADNGEIATALLFATLKAAPTGLARCIGVHWIERGALADQRLLDLAA